LGGTRPIISLHTTNTHSLIFTLIVHMQDRQCATSWNELDIKWESYMCNLTMSYNNKWRAIRSCSAYSSKKNTIFVMGSLMKY